MPGGEGFQSSQRGDSMGSTKDEVRKNVLLQSQLDLSVEQARGSHEDRISNNISSFVMWVTFPSNLV